MRITSTRRNRKPAKRLDVAPLRELLRDHRVWTSLGTVVGNTGGPHFEIVDGGEDCLVEVELHPDGIQVTARLGSCAGGPGMGLWRIPAVGDEVAVLVAGGQVDFMPMVVATLSTGAAPDRLAQNRTVLVATDEIEIIAPKVRIHPDPAGAVEVQEGVLNGQAQDPYTGLKHYQLGNASQSVIVKK